MTYPPLGDHQIRADATLDDLLDWYHFAVEAGTQDSYILTAAREFPHWAGELFEHAKIDQFLRNQPEAEPLTKEQEERLLQVGLEAVKKVLEKARNDRG